MALPSPSAPSGTPTTPAADLTLCGPPLAHIPLLDRLEPARSAGFTAISVTPADIWTLEGQGVSARAIAARVADAGLAIGEVDCTAWWLPSHRLAPPDARLRGLLAELTPARVIETAARIGARSVVVVEMIDVRPSLDEAAEAFAGVCDLAARHGLRAHIEFLPFGGIPDLAGAWAIVDAAGRPNGGLTIDSWHLFRSGSTLDQLAAIPGDRIHSVQINDAPSEPGPDLFAETMESRLLPGEGSFDLVGLIRMLDRIGSTAPIGVEIFSAAAHSDAVAVTANKWATAARSILDVARENI